MSTILVNVPEKEKDFFNSLLKKFKFKSHTISKEELEEAAIAKWIEKGMKSKDIPLKELYKFLKENGVNS
ncbi:MAG TPA: hypothetical protein VK809_13470 [Bacteroidia bacterium]|jgi:hypothetical protein|nr:hypothetical protein [Bacteroidia bacterium]